jgi:predicted amidohydrolase YtcJ
VPEDEGRLLVLNGRVFRPGRTGSSRPIGSSPGPAPEGAPTAVAVVGERIAAVGTDADIIRDWGDGAEPIDARGGLITAGLEDAHIHFRMGAMSLVGADLSGAASVEELIERVRAYAARNPDRDWIMGRGWTYGPFGDRLPTRDELDRAVPDRPAFMDCFDGHTGWANSRALAAAGIDRDTPDPPGGVIVRDPSTGEPTGALKEMAAELVEAASPQPSEDEKLDALVEASRLYAAAGLTSAQDAWSSPEEFRLYERLQERGPLTARMRLALQMEPRLDPAEWDRRLAGWEESTFPWRTDPWIRGGIVKGFVDGVVESRTAYMLGPYEGDTSRGLPNWSDEELREAVAIAHRRGWQVELHAIGDAGVRQALDAYEALGPGQAAERRHRIEHIETIDPADIPRFARLGVVASMQPHHMDPQPADLAVFTGNIGPERARTAFPWASIVRSGAVLALGSDWPVVRFDPSLALHAATTRQTADGWPEGGWQPQERIGIAEALDAYSWGGAYAAHAEEERGRVEPGALADLTVFDRDLLTEGPGATPGVRAMLTLVGGQAVHRLLG